MDNVKRSVSGVVVLALGALAVGQLGFLKGSMPSDLGVNNGRLKPPALTPNSVSSQAALYPDHPQRAFADIAPLALIGDGQTTLAKIKALVQGRADVEVIKSEPDYLYLQFTSRLMKYVDDVEFWHDPANRVVQVRSASRLGGSDLGANRRRVESLRAELATLSK